MSDSRYPYTYACDFVRGHSAEILDVAGVSMRVPALSRSQASQVMHAFELVFGLSHEDMAKKLADYSLKESTR